MINEILKKLEKAEKKECHKCKKLRICYPLSEVAKVHGVTVDPTILMCINCLWEKIDEYKSKKRE